MKKISVAIVTVSLMVSLFSLATAGNNGMGGECGNCPQSGATVPSDPLRKFQADTIDLRQEMMIKRFDMQRENLKGTPDTAKIASLQADVKALQTKILALRAQSGLPVDKCDGECVQSMGGCDKMGMGGKMGMNGGGKAGMGGCGKGPGGCNGTPCGQK